MPPKNQYKYVVGRNKSVLLPDGTKITEGQEVTTEQASTVKASTIASWLESGHVRRLRADDDPFMGEPDDLDDMQQGPTIPPLLENDSQIQSQAHVADPDRLRARVARVGAPVTELAEQHVAEPERVKPQTSGRQGGRETVTAANVGSKAAFEGKWNLDPDGLRGKGLDELNALAVERDPTVKPFGDVQEARVFLSRDFKPRK